MFLLFCYVQGEVIEMLLNFFGHLHTLIFNVVFGLTQPCPKAGLKSRVIHFIKLYFRKWTKALSNG